MHQQSGHGKHRQRAVLDAERRAPKAIVQVGQGPPPGLGVTEELVDGLPQRPQRRPRLTEPPRAGMPAMQPMRFQQGAIHAEFGRVALETQLG